MKLSHENSDQISVVTIRGDVTAEHAEALRKYLGERLRENARDFVLMVPDVDFVDSKGLEALLWAQDQCAERLGQVRLAQVSGNVARILDITRLAPRFECHRDLDSAIKSLR